MEKILKKLTAILFLAAGFTAFAAEHPGVTDSPYGACAHLNRWEYPEMQEELHMMKEARIGFDRTDLDWAQVEPKPGEWNFSRWDAIVGAAEKTVSPSCRSSADSNRNGVRRSPLIWTDGKRI